MKNILKIVRKNVFFIILLLLIILVYIITFYPLLGVMYSSNDDMWFAIFSQKSIYDIVETASTLAQQQARIQWHYVMFVYILPYIFDNQVYYYFLKFFPLLLNSILFGYIVNKLSRSRILSLISVLFYAIFIQNSFDHNQLVSYVFIFPFAFNLILLSIILIIIVLENIINQSNVKKVFTLKNKLLTFSSVLLYFAAISMSEVFLAYLSLYFVVIPYYLVKSDRSDTHKLIISFLTPYVVATVFFLVPYLIYRDLNPPIYQGTSYMNFDISLIMKVIFQFSIASLPIQTFWQYSDLFQQYSYLENGHVNSLLWPIIHSKPIWIIKGILSSLIIALLFSQIERLLKKETILLLLGIGLILFVSPSILLSISQKYQQWVMNGVNAYVFTYYSFFGSILIIGTISIAIYQSLSSLFLKNLYVFLFLIIVSTGSIITDYSNYHVTLKQSQGNQLWETIDQFIEAKEFQSIEDNSIIFAPSLWTKDGSSFVYQLQKDDPRSNYWTNYFNSKTNKKIEIIRDIKDIYNFVDTESLQEKKIYYLRYGQERNVPNQLIVFGQISDMKTIDNQIALIGNNPNILLISDYEKNEIFYKKEGQNIFAKQSINNTSQKRIVSLDINNVHFDSMHTTFFKREIINRPTITIKWENGFYQQEGLGSGTPHRWAESNARLYLINNSQEPQKIQLSASFISATGEKASLKISSDLVSDTFFISDEPFYYIKDLILSPGENVLDFSTDANRLSTPLETRNLHFDVINLQINRN